METFREFSDVTITVLPIKKTSDEKMSKTAWEIEKDLSIAQKIADRFNNDAKFNRGKISLNDRFEMAAMGYELKSKKREGPVDREITIYKKEKRADVGCYSPLPNSPNVENFAVHKPAIPRARGFYRATPEHAPSSASSSCSNDFLNTPSSPSGYPPRTPPNNYYRNNNNNNYIKLLDSQVSTLVNGSEIVQSFGNLYRISVVHEEEGEAPQLNFSFTNKKYVNDFGYQFRKMGRDQTLVAYRWGPESVEKWTKQESGKPKDVRMRYFNEYVEHYKNCISKFEFSEDDTCVCAYNIQMLKNLKEIEVVGFGMKDRNGIEGGFINIEQLSKLNHLDTYDLRFTFEEFSKFDGERARFRLKKEEFTQRNILEYLKKRQSGQIHQNLRFLQFFCSNKVSLDTDHLMMELDGYRSTDETNGLKAIRFRSDVMEKRFIFRYDDLVEVYFELKWEGTSCHWSPNE